MFSSFCEYMKSSFLYSLRAQLTDARNSIERLKADNDRMIHERRPGSYHHDKQLEEIRLHQVQQRLLSRHAEFRTIANNNKISKNILKKFLTKKQ